MKFLSCIAIILVLVSCGDSNNEDSKNKADQKNEFGSKAKTSVLFPYWDKFGFRVGRGKYRAGYMNLKGEKVIDHQFWDAKPFSEGLGCVKVKVGKDMLYGYIDKTGDFVIEPQFKQARSFQNGRAWVSYNYGHYGVIDKKGELVTDTIYKSMSSDFMNGHAIAYIDAGKKQPSRLERVIIRTISLGILRAHPSTYYDVFRIDLDGVATYVETSFDFDAVDSVIVRRSSNLGMYLEKDSKLDLIGYLNVNPSDHDRNHRFYDKTDNVAIPAQFTQAEDFENGYARVTLKSGKKAYINTEGKVVFTYVQDRPY